MAREAATDEDKIHHFEMMERPVQVRLQDALLNVILTDAESAAMEVWWQRFIAVSRQSGRGLRPEGPSSSDVLTFAPPLFPTLPAKISDRSRSQSLYRGLVSDADFREEEEWTPVDEEANLWVTVDQGWKDLRDKVFPRPGAVLEYYVSVPPTEERTVKPDGFDAGGWVGQIGRRLRVCWR